MWRYPRSASRSSGVDGDRRFVSEDFASEGLAIAFVSCDGDDDEALSALNRALMNGARLAVIMRGRRGSLAGSGGEIVEASALPVSVRDTTGAGDSFIAGFLSAHVAGKPTADCLASGHEAAAYTCQVFGGFEQGEEN